MVTCWGDEYSSLSRTDIVCVWVGECVMSCFQTERFQLEAGALQQGVGGDVGAAEGGGAVQEVD